MYTVWIRIDETLPWIELKKEYATRREARQAAQHTLDRLAVKLVRTSEKSGSLKAFATSASTDNLTVFSSDLLDTSASYFSETVSKTLFSSISSLSLTVQLSNASIHLSSIRKLSSDMAPGKGLEPLRAKGPLAHLSSIVLALFFHTISRPAR